ncbi:hypothetical protein [Frateuria sp. YIM B11624]|uniref:hypothetical protein n=1 Tax=Frateuria sp. YIM B11624 TaxID=3143185 RepID=UPI003C77D1D4
MALSKAESASQIRTVAIDMVAMERTRQIQEEGFDFDHDDQHAEEELAAAAAFFITPSTLCPDVCVSTEDYGLEVIPLLQLIGRGAWNGIDREDLADAFYEAACPALDRRINVLTKGLALGVAELERLLRLREATDQGEDA